MHVSRWPRFQFRLRTLLLFVLIVSIPLSWLGSRLRSARAQKEAVARLQPGDVWYDFHFDEADHSLNTFQYEYHDCGWQELNISRICKKMPGPQWLHDLLGDDFFISVVAVRTQHRRRLADFKYFPHLRELELWGSDITDADLAQLGQERELEGIDFNATSISDAGFEHIRGLTRLRKLCLSNTRITDAGLSYIAELRRLELLNLDGTQITDAGLDHLVRLSTLQWLSLRLTHVSDAGLRKLEKLRKLKELNVYGTAVTEDGVERLRKELPGCHIH